MRKTAATARRPNAAAGAAPRLSSLYCLSLLSVLVAVLAIITCSTSFFASSSSSTGSMEEQDKACGLVMAESTLPDSGFGVFALQDYDKGLPITPGDVAVQVVDITPAHAQGMRRLLHDYLWQGHVSGGVFEGQVVLTALPGVGMLGNSLPQHLNVVPHKATYDGSAVHKTANAGAVTDYRDFSFYTYKPIRAGEEVFVDYGTGYFGERDSLEVDIPKIPSRSTDWLRQNGVCLDNIVSKGYGGFASRDLPVHSAVAPVPVLPLSRSALEGLDPKKPKQLLWNYCYGHPKSSLLLFSYGPMVNLVNHPATDQVANVELRWSRFNKDEWMTMPLDELLQQNSSGLLLELVAIRDIAKGDEILLDYGDEWQAAWDRHVDQWQPLNAGTTPSYEMNKILMDEPIRTVQEQQDDPYPSNLVTSCYYRYADNRGRPTADWSSVGLGPHHLRPCAILQRHGSLYTVQIMNRPGLERSEVVESQHVVTTVPRLAIQFSDRTYTTDQHQPHAFRHEIHIPDAIFPDAWKDMV